MKDALGTQCWLETPHTVETYTATWKPHRTTVHAPLNQPLTAGIVGALVVNSFKLHLNAL